MVSLAKQALPHQAQGATVDGRKDISVAFFDLGGTLVGKNRDWIVGAPGTLTALRARDVRLGIISNTGTLLRPAILQLLPLDFEMGLFDQELLIFSSEVGTEKPNQSIFL